MFTLELAPTRLSIVEEFLGPQSKTFHHQFGLEQGKKTWNKCNMLRSEQNHSVWVIYTLEITGKFLFPGAKHRGTTAWPQAMQAQSPGLALLQWPAQLSVLTRLTLA